MKTIDPKELSVAELHGHLLGAIAPRPIAFASTINSKGQVNLSPFSFFNVFSANPPTLIFSPARRVRDNTTKHTLQNVEEVAEVVVNIVDFKIVEQMSLASTEYGPGINEFLKAGLTEVASTHVAPPRVGEAPAAFECTVKDIVPLGTGGGAGNLIICEVVLAHFQDHIFDDNGKINPQKLDAVARMGGDWYCRAQGEALFELPKPNRDLGIGVDQIPEKIRNSHILSGNHLGRLGNVSTLPSKEEIGDFAQTPENQELYHRLQNHPESFEDHVHMMAKEYLESNDPISAWKALLMPHPNS